MQARRRRTGPFATSCLAAALLAIGGAAAYAQRIDPRRPRTLIVGPSGGPTPVERVDPQRTGRAASSLPTAPLRVAWRRSLGAVLDSAPLVDDAGEVTVVTTRGDVVTLARDGTERAHVVTGTAAIGGAARLADGTVVFVDGAGEAVGVRAGALRFQTRLGGDRATLAAHSSPLPLADGGVVVSSATELLALDAEGNVRARSDVHEALSGPLVAALGSVVATTVSGAVVTWAPGREPSRAGSFGGPLDEGALLEGDHTLLAVVGGSQLAALDLTRGVAVARGSTASSGVLAFFGPPARLAGPGGAGDATALLALAPARLFVLTLDALGRERARAAVALAPAANVPDGGAAAPVPPHTGLLTDPEGRIAFATQEGALGTVAPDGAVSTLSDPPCARTTLASSARGALHAGLSPAGPGAFVVACASGIVARIEGASP